MLEILQYCNLYKCAVKFSFEIPGQITITVTNSKNNNSFSQQLPWSHIANEKIIDCIDYCIKKTNVSAGTRPARYEQMIPVPADQAFDFISETVFSGIMNGVRDFLSQQKTGQSYWMVTQVIQLLKVPEEFHEKCEKFKAVVGCNHLEDHPLDLKGIFIFCCDNLSDTKAIDMAKNICVIPPQSLS